VRITTLGEFTLEWLIQCSRGSGDEPPRYACVPRGEWSNRGPAMALLKVLREEQAEPAVYTRELARRIRQGLVLRESGERYTTAGVQTTSLVERDLVSRDHGDGFCARGARMAITARCRGQMPSPYRYCLPRRRSRRHAARLVG
jgi:hypothetical protein